MTRAKAGTVSHRASGTAARGFSPVIQHTNGSPSPARAQYTVTAPVQRHPGEATPAVASVRPSWVPATGLSLRSSRAARDLSRGYLPGYQTMVVRDAAQQAAADGGPVDIATLDTKHRRHYQSSPRPSRPVAPTNLL
jgi:hypothetical protein